MVDLISYAGKRVVITGCYSGMGEAAARLLLELGAEVHGLDNQPCALPLASFTHMELRDPGSIEAAAAGLAGDFDALFNCAGVSFTYSPLDMMKINFIGPRMLTRLLAPRLRAGGAIACISSTAGLGWSQRIPQLLDLIGAGDYEAMVRWCETQLGASFEGYGFSKEAVVVWTLREAQSLIGRGVRMNCILPGPTQTPFIEKQVTITPATFIDAYTHPINRRARPEEQALPLLFLNSEAASYINGVALPVDGGFAGGVSIGMTDVRDLIAKASRRAAA